MTRLSPQVDKAQAKHRGKLRGRRAEYADPKTMTRLSPRMDEHKPLNRGKLREPKTENFLHSKLQQGEHNISSEENSMNFRWKSDGEGKRSGGNRSRTANALYNCTTGAHVTRCNGQPLQNLNGAGKPARAGGRCNVIMPSRPVRVRARMVLGVGRYLRPRRRQLVSESVPHTCRTAGPCRPD